MKKVLQILGILCLVASAVMYGVGTNSSHLSELKDFFWAPLPLAIIFLIIGFRADKGVKKAGNEPPKL